MIRNEPQLSGRLSDFLNQITEAQKDYHWNYDEVNRLDQQTQDYLHSLELDGLDYKGRAKIATQIAKCRQLRRNSKDTVVALTPLVEFVESEKGKNLVSLLKEILGKTRKAEQYIENRTYRRRIE